MDFDSCIRELCQTCYPACQSHPNFTISSGDIKLERRNHEDKCKSEMKRDTQGTSTDIRCGFNSNSDLDESEMGLKEDDVNHLSVHNGHKTGNHLGFGGDDRVSLGPYFMSEDESKRCNCYVSNKTPDDNFCDMEEKVNFLFELFKYSENKPSENEVANQKGIKIPGITLRDVWQLYNVNRRIAAAEKKIEKLSITVHEVLNKITKIGNAISNVDDSNYGHSLGMDEMTPRKKITVLKNRNDLLISLMKTFLKIGTVDEMYSKLALLPKSQDPKQVATEQSDNMNLEDPLMLGQDEIMDTLKSLRGQIHEINISKGRKFSLGENLFLSNDESDEKFTRNKLEVISEHGEINLKENLEKNINKVKKEPQRYRDDLYEDKNKDLTTSWPFLSYVDAANHNKTNVKTLTPCQSDTFSGERTSKLEMQSNLESPRYNSFPNVPKKENEKIFRKESAQTSAKYSRLTDFKEIFKNSVRNGCNNFNKPNIGGTKQEEMKVDPEKDKPPRKIINKGSNSLLKAPAKSIRPGCFSPDLSTSRRLKDAVAVDNLRPVTAPNAAQKIIPPTEVRKQPSGYTKPCLDLNRTKKGFNNSSHSSYKANVKNLNKNYLNKKFFVQTL